MPIYEYVCQDCKERFELMRPMKDADAAAACRKCNSQNIARLLSVCYANSGGRALAGSGGGGCAGCSGGSCASCGH